MPATLVTTWGSTTANSYVTEAFVDSYADDYILDDQWTALNTAVKSRAILRATRDIDNARLWIGVRNDSRQALQFPREVEFEDRLFDADSAFDPSASSEFDRLMQERVEKATAEQAIYLAKNSTTDTEHLDRQRQGIASFSESVGPLSESISYTGGGANNSPARRLSADAYMLMKYYVDSPKLVRGGAFDTGLRR